jgi:hypothetical protein
LSLTAIVRINYLRRGCSRCCDNWPGKAASAFNHIGPKALQGAASNSLILGAAALPHPLEATSANHPKEGLSLKTPDEFAEAMKAREALSHGDINGSLAAPGTGGKQYSPCPQTRLLNTLALLLCGGVALWMAWRGLGNHHPLLAGVVALGAVLAITGVAYVTTVRVVIDDRTLVRTWLMGRRVIVLEDIAQLGLVQYKGTVSLLIRKSRWRQLSLSSDAFDWQDVRCMHRDILLALGLDTEPMWPTVPRWLGMLDVAAVLSYRRFQAERQGSDGGCDGAHLEKVF